jgi:hypothetical protein
MHTELFVFKGPFGQTPNLNGYIRGEWLNGFAVRFDTSLVAYASQVGHSPKLGHNDAKNGSRKSRYGTGSQMESGALVRRLGVGLNSNITASY